MPRATQYNPEDKHIREAADEEFRVRRALRDRNWRYYSGDHKKPLKLSGAFDDNVRINLCRQAVDRTIAFMVPAFPMLQLHAIDDTDDERFLRRAWQQRDGAVLLKSMALNGALDGHVFVKLVHEDAPRMVVLDGTKIIKFVDAGDAARTLWYELRWKEGHAEWRQDIVNDGEQWLFLEWQRNGSRWEHLSTIPWPYPLSPIVDWQHMPLIADIYGQHEFQHAELNDQVNKVYSDINRIVRFHAAPRTVALGLRGDDVQETAIDGMWAINKKPGDVSVEILEMQSDLEASMRFAELLTQAFFRESRVFIPEMNQSHQRTAYEVRLDYRDMSDKNNMLTAQYASMGIVPISQRLLMLANRPYELMSLHVEWPNPLPTNPLEDVKVAQLMKDQLGILSPQTAAERLGLDYEMEQQRMPPEKEA